MAIQTVLSSNTFNQFRVTTNQVIANVNSQFDGTANVVLNSANSAFANIHNLTVYGDAAIQGGDITTNNLTFTLANTTATTLQLGGAANVLIGSTTGNTTIRSANTVLTGDLHVNGGDILSTSTTLNIANTTATTLSVGGAATSLLLGATTGTATIRNATTVIAGDLTVSGGDIVGTATLNLANVTTTSLSIGGAATTLNMGATTGNTTIRSGNTIVFGDMWVNGGELRSTNTTFNLANSLPTTLGVGGSATTVLIGANTGTTTIRNANVVLYGDLAVNGGDITTSSATFNVANATATTVSVGGAATALLIGATTGTTTIRNASTVVTGDLTVSGGDIIGTASLNLANVTTTTLNIGGAANVNIGSTAGNTTIRSANTVLTGDLHVSANAFIGSTTGNTTIQSANTVLTGDLHVNGGDINTTATTFTLANTTATTMSVGGAATALLLGATTGTATIRNATTVVTGDLNVNGGDINTTATTFTLANTTATTLQLGGAANVLIGSTAGNTTIRSANTVLTGDLHVSANAFIGSTTGNTTIRSANTVLTGDLFVNGGDIFTTNTIFSIANNTATTVWLGAGATSNVIVGATTGNTTLRSADTTVDGKLTVKGITNIGVNTSTDAVRITQEGSGNALVIQDTSSDSSPIVVDERGRLIMGGTGVQSTWYSSARTPNHFITGNGLNGDGLGIITYGSVPIILMGRHGPNTLNTRGTVSNGDVLGSIDFSGDDGTTAGLPKGAVITALVDSVVDTANTTTIPTTLQIRTKTANVSTPGITASFSSDGVTTLTGNLAVNGNVLSTTNTQFAIANSTATTVSVGGAATSLLIGATTGTTTIRNASTVVTGDLTVSGGDIIGTASLNLANVTSTTLNIGGAATTLNIGATTGNTTIRNAGTVIAGDLFVQGGDIVATTSALNLANTTTTTLNIGGAANVITIGAANSGTFTINNNKAVINSTGALRVPVGNTAQRGTASQGEVRYNTQLTAYEGYDGTNWSSLGGVKSVDGLTYIIAESSPGNSDDTLHFYTANGATSYEVAQMNATKLAILQTTASTSATTGALTVAGGVGINERLYVNGVTTISANLTVAGNTAINGGGVTTTNSIFTVANTTATLLELGGAANVNIGSTAGNTTIRSANTIITGNTIIGGNLTVNGNTTIINSTTLSIDDKNIILADGAADNAAANGAGITIAGSNANVVYLSASDSFSLNKNVIAELDLAVNGGDITTTSTTFNVANATATTLSVGGAATSLLLGASSGTATIRNSSTVLNGDLNVNGGDINTTATTFTVANTTATTMSVGGAATALLLGATTGTATIRNANTVVTGDLFVNGGDINTTSSNFAIGNTSTTSLWLGAGVTSNVLIGSTSATTFIRSANTIVNGNFTANGTITETANGQQWLVASQYDIGMNPNQIPLNQYLGSMAFQSADGISVGAATVSADLSVNSGNVITTSTTFNVANTTATSVSVGGAANVLIGSIAGNTNIRSANTVVSELFVNGGDIFTTASTFTVANNTATTLQLGGSANVLIGSTAGNTTIRSANTVVSELFVNGGDINTTATTFTVANTTATTMSVGGAATTVLIGATTGTATIRNATVNLLGSALTGPATFALANTTSTTLSVGGAATSLLIGATTGTATIRNASTIISGDLNVNGGDINTTATTFTVANTTATLLELGGAANVNIGSTSGNTTIRSGNTIVFGDMYVNGGELRSTNTTFNLANSFPTTLGVGGAATTVLIGATTGTTTIRNATVNLLGSALTGPATFSVANTTSTTLGVGGAATSLLIGATTGTATIRNATVNLLGSALTGPATFALANTTTTTLGVGGAATSLLIGATTGNTTIRSGNTIVSGDMYVNGGELRSTNATFNLANSFPTSLGIGGSATTVLIGATTGTTTIRNANVVVTGTLSARYATKVANTATATSLTPDVSQHNQFSYTALASALTINAPTGTPTDGERLLFRIKDNGTSRAITWNAIYRIVGTVLPVATVANKISYVGCIYNEADTKWDVVAVSREA